MRPQHAIATFALGTALAAVTPASAAGTCDLYVGNRCLHDGPVGRKCAFNSTIDVTREVGWQVGDLNAGPLATGTAGTLFCSIHVNNNRHSGAAAAGGTASAAAVGGVVAFVAPTVVGYAATAADDVSLCTAWVPDSGPALYWVSESAPGLGFWTTDGSASCSQWGPSDPNYPECGIWLAVDQRAGTNLAGVWQDCEPYEPII